MSLVLKNPLYAVEFVGGPLDGMKKLIGLQETTDILKVTNTNTGAEVIYEWREDTFEPYLFDWCGTIEG